MSLKHTGEIQAKTKCLFLWTQIISIFLSGAFSEISDHCQSGYGVRVFLLRDWRLQLQQK